MQLYRDTDAPSLDRGVERRLARLDPNLEVTWSKWSINGLTSQPILHRGRPVYDPAYHLWRRDRGTARYHYVRAYLEFGHNEVYALEADAARTMRPEEIIALNQQLYEDRVAREDAARKQERADMIQANRGRISDLVFDNKLGRRDAKITSFSGQTHRGTPGQIQMDAKEDGWERPEEAP